MRMSALNERRAALVEKLVSAVVDYDWTTGPMRATGHDEEAFQLKVECLRRRFTALMASRWQT